MPTFIRASSSFNRNMGHGTRGARLPSKNILARTVTFVVSLASLYILFLVMKRDYSTTSASTLSATSPDTSHRSDWGLTALADLGRSDHPTDGNAPPESDRYSSLPRFADQPATATKRLPSCVTDNQVAGSFLMIFMGHSGSTAIISELQGHSKMLIEDVEPIDHNEYEKNTSLALAYTRDFFMRGKKEGKIPGFKMRPWHIRQNPQAWIDLTREFGTRIIWQYRQNILKQAVGEYSYKYLKDESVVEGLKSQHELEKRCTTGAGCRFKITNFPFFHRILKDTLHSDMAITRGVHLILNGSTCVHEMPYESYLYDRENAMSRLQQFLRVEHEDTTPSRFKATSDSLCEVVENWNEVCEKFYGCHVWRHMFDDRQNGCMCEFSSGPVHYCDTIFENEVNESPRKIDKQD